MCKKQKKSLKVSNPRGIETLKILRQWTHQACLIWRSSSHFPAIEKIYSFSLVHKIVRFSAKSSKKMLKANLQRIQIHHVMKLRNNYFFVEGATWKQREVSSSGKKWRLTETKTFAVKNHLTHYRTFCLVNKKCLTMQSKTKRDLSKEKDQQNPTHQLKKLRK